MHPAKSVILFTTASGAGYGLLILFALFDILGVIPADQKITVVVFALAIGLITLGLFSSLFHLGHPERAWRALSQWRSSWLSREGVMALLSFAPILLYGGMRFFYTGFDPVWIFSMALLTAVMAIGTVSCTAMIYASLKTVPAWRSPFTPLGYLVLSLASGALLLNAIAHVQWFGGVLVPHATAVLLALGAVVKLLHWRATCAEKPVSTPESATGIAAAGERVHLFEAPHDSDNYLMKEMGFRIARHHAGRLRRMVILWGFLFPILGVYVASFGPQQTALLPIGVSLLTGVIGLIAERYLFFAEAKHVVGLYYGK